MHSYFSHLFYGSNGGIVQPCSFCDCSEFLFWLTNYLYRMFCWLADTWGLFEFGCCLKTPLPELAPSKLPRVLVDSFSLIWLADIVIELFDSCPPNLGDIRPKDSRVISSLLLLCLCSFSLKFGPPMILAVSSSIYSFSSLKSSINKSCSPRMP